MLICVANYYILNFSFLTAFLNEIGYGAFRVMFAWSMVCGMSERVCLHTYTRV
jgi:hypothetical protein